jgi:hypothetical protein
MADILYDFCRDCRLLQECDPGKNEVPPCRADAVALKTFAIVHYLAGGSGHTVTIVRAKDEFEAATIGKPYLAPLRMTVTEITEDMQTVLDYDDPNYEG